MSAVSGLDGKSWTVVVFSLGAFLIVSVCAVFLYACCRACRKERHRQVGEHVISEAVAHPPLDKPPSYWRFFRTLSSLKLSQSGQVPDGSAYLAEAVPGTPPPKYDDLGFLFEILPGGKYAKESDPTANQEDPDQGIFFTTRTSPTLRHVHSSIMLSHLTENPSTPEPRSNRTSPTQDVRNNVWPTLDTGDIPKNTENPTMCLEQSFRKLLANNVSSAGNSSQAMPAEEPEVYITKL